LRIISLNFLLFTPCIGIREQHLHYLKNLQKMDSQQWDQNNEYS
jgi:hypothetical protein